MKDANSVEAALLLSGKKFPPMLPRQLRVSRCKAPHKTVRAMERSRPTTSGANTTGLGRSRSTKHVPKPTTEELTLAGRKAKLLGHVAATRGQRPVRPAQPRNRAGKGDILPRTTTNEQVFKSPETIVFEGHRASSKNGKPKGLKMKGSRVKKGKRESNNKARQAQRTSKWREKSGGPKTDS